MKRENVGPAQSMAAAATTRKVFDLWPLKLIEPSKTNPRKLFDKIKLAELADSIKTHGVLQPILVRQLDGTKDHQIVELVCGERRYRAAKMAGLTDIPTIVKELTDAQALEIQIIENLQREDLHPIEEAEGYERMLAGFGKEPVALTVAAVAAQVGKSPAYVLARLKLCQLTEPNRKLFFDGKLTAQTALMIARIPKELQGSAAKDITHGGGEPMSTNEAFRHVHRVYMLELKRAPFPTADATLVPAAGACGPCPKRTGNQKELFGDVKSGETCTDPTCYSAKRTAHAERLLAAAKEKGQTVFTGDKARKILPYDQSSGNDGWIRLDAKCHDDQKFRTYREILGKQAPLPALVETDAGMIQVVRLADIKDLLREKGVKREPGGTHHAEQKARDTKARHETVLRRAVHAALRERVPTVLPPPALNVVAVAFYERLEHETRKAITRLWTTDTKKPIEDLTRSFEKVIAKMNAKQLALVLVDMAVIRESHAGAYHARPTLATQALCKLFKVNANGVRRKADAEVKAAAAKKAPKAKSKPKV